MRMTDKVWNEQKIAALLASDDYAVEKAILAIYKLQTEDERNEGTTKHSNSVGFSGADANRGTYYARWIKSGRKLTGEHLSKARAMVTKYRKQLLSIALDNAAKKLEKVSKGSGHCETCGSLGYGRITAQNGDVTVICNLCDKVDNP